MNFGSGKSGGGDTAHYATSRDFRVTLKAIPLILILFLGFAFGITSFGAPSFGVSKLFADKGGDHTDELTVAYQFIIDGSYTEAAGVAWDVIREDDSNSLAHHILGLANARRGYTEEASRDFNRAVEIDPQFDLAWYDLGIVEESRGEFTLAYYAYNKALELDPENETYIDSSFQIEQLLAREGLWDREIVENEGLFLDAINAYNRGTPDDITFAETTFRELVARRPYDVASRNMLAMTLVKQGNLRESEQILLAVVDEEPGFSDAWYNLGIIYKKQSRYEESIQMFEKAFSSSSLENFQHVVQKELESLRAIVGTETRITP